jgi:glycosyltransferase involved in cell wall biosynthesis
VLGKPVVFNPLITLTDTLIDDRRAFASRGVRAGLIRLVDRLALSLANVILVDTAENGTYLTEQFGISPARIHVLPVGADETLFGAGECLDSNHLVGAAQVEKTGFSVLFYGNMIPLQGVDTIVRAARLLRDADVRFEIIGTGQTLDEARALAADIGADNIDWVERVPYAELPRRIARADVVLGIFGDTAKAARVVPNKVYQAMAMGAAIVTRDSSAQRSMLTDGASALLVPPADPEALADAIRRLRDPELRARLGAAAYLNFVERAGLGVQAERLRDALGTVVFAATGRAVESISS